MFFKKRQQRRAIEKLKKTRVPKFVPFNAARRVAFILEADEAGISEAAYSLISVLKENKADWRAIVIDFDNKNTADFS